MTERVVSLNGGQVPGKREVRQDVIKTLEELLEAARSGEVVGFVGVAVCFDECVMRRAAGLYISHTSVGALINLAHNTTSLIDQ